MDFVGTGPAGSRSSFLKRPLSVVAEPGTVLGELRDPEVFSRVYVDSNGSMAWDRGPPVDSDEVWSNRIGLSVDEIYVNGRILRSS